VNSFAWSRGVRALTIFLVQYVGWSKKYRPEDFEIRGERNSPAASLDMGLGKGKSKDQVNIQWQQSMFGTQGKNASSYLPTYIERTNPDQKRKSDPFGLKVLVSQLPPACVHVFVGDKELKEFPEIKVLSEKLCKQWKGKQNLPLWPAVEPKKDVLVLAPDALTSSKITTTQTSSPASKSLAELFKSLPVTSIISHITAALLPARGQDAIEKSVAEILSPECINLLAEKIVEGSINEFCDFFYTNYDSPPNIKKCVATLLSTNKNLRANLAFKVARSGFYDILGWFGVFSFFCDRQIVLEVENSLNTAAKEPGFKERFLIYAPELLPKLIKYFSDYGCVVAVRLFEKINQEGREEQIRIDKLLHGDSGTEKP
jgi:hypothetical protein